MAVKREVAINRADETVARAINDVLADVLDHPAKTDYEVWIATAYFNPGGFSLLADELERVRGARLLIGAEPTAQQFGDQGPRISTKENRRNQLRRALEGHARSIEQDRDLLGFQRELDETSRRLIAWLRSGQVEVRRFERGFLHGKAFLIASADEAVIAGSSNFTRAGLSTNRELNLGWYQPSVVSKVKDWFTDAWTESEAYDLAAIYEERYAPHSPYLIYLRMLFERYGSEVEEEALETDDGSVHLTSFQRDGVWRAKRILDRHNGVVVADGVGLGKTYIAGEIVREYEKDRRQRVLIVAPAALRDGPWRKFLDDHLLSAKCISYEDFAKQMDASGGQSVEGQRVEDYSLVVIDEGHAFRNPDTQRSEELRRFLSGTPAKNVMLLTATPVNNSLWDLYSLLSLFIKNDAAFADRGVLSLRGRFAEASALNPDDLSPDRLFDVLDEVAVRRTRRFVSDYYSGDRITVNGQEMSITFPQVQVEPPVGYSMDMLLPGFFVELEHALDCNTGSCSHEDMEDLPSLSLARYAPSRYSQSGEADAYELQLAGLLRSGLLKRFESSVRAFALTCARMADSHESFLLLLDEGRIATGPALAEWSAVETDELQGAAVPSTVLEGSFDAANYDVDSLRADIEADRKILRGFAARAASIDRHTDPKLAALVNELAAIVRQARTDAVDDQDERDKRKVIIFSYYTDTIEWIDDHLTDVLDPNSPVHDARLAPLAGRTVSITGDASTDKTRVTWGFAPRSSEAPAGHDSDLYDVLLSTDVMAEGVNLQQARHIVNFDLPWNPMRLVQRHGRIDRIGSAHPRVFIRCFFPDRNLDSVLGLEERLRRKLTQAARSVGVEEGPLPGSKSNQDVIFSETRNEIARLRNQDASIFLQGGEKGDAYSGEEYRQELRRGLDSPMLNAIKRLPWGSGSGRVKDGADPGFVFCARVAGYDRRLFRYVSVVDPANAVVTSDTLTCLEHAHADEATERVLGEEAHRLAYTAWDLAKADIFRSWTEATDPRNLSPEVPKAMRDAADFIVDHPPAEMSPAEADRLADSLKAPYPERIRAVFRAVLRSDAPPETTAALIATEAERLGLEPSPPPEPLPIIARRDVHLVCWMAIMPYEGAAFGEIQHDLLAAPQTTLD